MKNSTVCISRVKEGRSEFVQKLAGHHFSRPKIRQGIHFCHPKLPQIARWRAVRAFSNDIDLKQANSRIMHA